MNNDTYTQFKLAFLDQVTLKGYDADFIEGFFKRAEDEYSKWVSLVQTTYNGDPALCKQAFVEATFALHSASGEKTANAGLGPEILGFLDQLGSGAGSLFGQQAGSGLGGALAGGGGGMLLGLLLSQMFDVPLPMAMMLGALGGGALGYGAAGTQTGREKVFGSPSPGAPSPAPAPKSATPNPTAAAGVQSGQAVANAAAIPGAAPAAPPPQMNQPPKPVTPPTPGGAPAPGGVPTPGQPPLGAPNPAPVTPPGGMPAIKPPGQK